MAMPILIVALATAPPAIADDVLKPAPMWLALQIPQDAPGEHCVRTTSFGPSLLQAVSLHRTFHDDFDMHPLKMGVALCWACYIAGIILRWRPGFGA